MGIIVNMNRKRPQRAKRYSSKITAKKPPRKKLITKGNKGEILDYVHTSKRPTIKGVCVLLDCSLYEFHATRKIDYTLRYIWLYLKYYRHIGRYSEKEGGARKTILEVFPYASSLLKNEAFSDTIKRE